MHAAMVEDFRFPPRYRETSPPVASEGEIVLQVRAAALPNLVRSQANGSHYSSVTKLPFTPGNDGVGVDADGARVYFFSPRPPFGSMAEFSVVSRSMTIPLAPEIDDAVAAALGNPGLATWGALLGRANFQPGEGVLINGATGIAGKQAIQVAKYLGASRIIATGRDERSPRSTGCSGRERDHLAAPAGRESAAEFPLGAGRSAGCSGLLVGTIRGTDLEGRGWPWIAARRTAHTFCADWIDQRERDHLACPTAPQLRS